MPRLNSETVNAKFNGHFGFSAEKLEKCAEVASAYCLLTIGLDNSGSVDPFKNLIIQGMKNVALSCQSCPAKENLMIRVVKFGDSVEEIHGFKFLKDIKPEDYDGCIDCKGMTALNDALYGTTEATIKYGTDLSKQGYQVNAVNIIITDGFNNSSKVLDSDLHLVKEMLVKAKMDEQIESILTTLVGVNTAANGVSQKLQEVKDNCGFLNYIDLKDAKPTTLAKLWNWISQSASSSAQNAALGQPSQNITF